MMLTLLLHARIIKRQINVCHVRNWNVVDGCWLYFSFITVVVYKQKEHPLRTSLSWGGWSYHNVDMGERVKVNKDIPKTQNLFNLSWLFPPTHYLFIFKIYRVWEGDHQGSRVENSGMLCWILLVKIISFRKTRF